MKKFLILAAAALVAVPAVSHAEDKPTPPAQGEKGPGKMFKETDTNGDGKMSKDEFMAFHEKRFSEMDKNGDGQIDSDEARAKAKEWREKMEERRKEMMEKKGDAATAPKPNAMDADKTPAESIPESPAPTPSETLPAQ